MKINTLLVIGVILCLLGGMLIGLHITENKTNQTLRFAADREEVKQFILSDQTDLHEYIVGVYVCRDFVYDVIENASTVGIKAFRVTVHFIGDGNITHAIAMFPTTKDGNIYVDVTQGDFWVDYNAQTGSCVTYTITKPLKYSSSASVDFWGIRYN
jgi:hypothetical protein